MRRAWSEVMSRPSSYFLLVGRLHSSFGGGPQGPFDKHRLRFAGDLMKRCCSGLGFEGGFSVEGSRAGGTAIVHVAMESEADLDRLTSLTSSKPEPSTPWKAKADFELTEALHDRLLEFAGPPDQRGAGRRAREQRERDQEEQSLRWKVHSWRE